MVNTRWARSGLVLLVPFLVTAGCTVSFEPGLHGKTRADPNHADAPPGPPGANPALAGPGAAGKFAVPPPPVPAPVPAPFGPPGSQGSAADQVSFLTQRLQGAEDDRKIMAARLQQLEHQLREKDQAVVQTTYEVQESAKQTRKAREDLQRWKVEMNDLRGKLRTMEQENKVTLEAILKTLEQYVERDPPKLK